MRPTSPIASIRILATALMSIVLAVVAGAQSARGQNAASSASSGWNPQAAAQYLDRREDWWQAWSRPHIDHGTLCISCHTVLPYALARPRLRQLSGDSTLTSAERAMLTSVQTRVKDWSAMQPYYSDAAGAGKAVQSHATEAVLNAVLLAAYDREEETVQESTRAAFRAAWALQQPSGGWIWQDFQLAPWETANSGYFGATLLLLAARSLPQGFAAEPENKAHLDQLVGYLRREYASQPLINRIYALWASSTSPTLLDWAQRRVLLEQLRALQQGDGGWRSAGMDRIARLDRSAPPSESDGFVTALTTLALRTSGTAASDPMRQRAEAWLRSHQRADGSWGAASMNKTRPSESAAAPFMTDAATGYASLALAGF